MVLTQSIRFGNDNTATLIRGDTDGQLSALVEELLGAPPRGLVILNGGTAHLANELAQQLARALQDGLANVVAAERLTVITGGTDAGIFHLFGRGRAQWGAAAPCIGVAVANLVTWPGKEDGEAPLEPNHSHFVLTDGDHWGDETETMYALVRALAAECLSVAVFAGGGEITIHEMQANVAQGRPMIMLAGSGRATDKVLAARTGQPVDDARLVEIAQAGQILPFDLAEPPSVLAELVRNTLGLASVGSG
ncbi:MAG: hypothetical protein R2911_22905 [Caldilineaceae bacterium]